MTSPSFVHTDIRGILLAAKRANWPIDPSAIQESLVRFIAEQTASGMEGVIFPGFNYEYGTTRKFNVQDDPVQVGAIAEWSRAEAAFERTEIPFFSFLSKTQLELPKEDVINPFGAKSGFAWLVENDADIILFGAPFHTLTIIHYVEDAAGGPLYRYDKEFPGQIKNGSRSYPCNFSMHVRPKGVSIEYDWKKLEMDLVERRLLTQSSEVFGLSKLKARNLLNYWGERISEDPFFLVNQQTKINLFEKTDSGLHRVKREEFEDV